MTKEKGYKNILAAVDLSQASKLVMERAVELAHSYNAKLSLLHIVEPIPNYGYLDVAEIEATCLQQAKQELSKLAQTVDIPSSHQYIEKGLVKHEILNALEAHRVDLLVIGSHGHSGLARLLGSTASGVLHTANCDVLVVRLKG